MTLSEKIVALLRERNKDFNDLARSTGLPYNTVRSYAKPGSTRVPTAPNGVLLARSLDVPTDWLFDNNAPWPPPPRSEQPPFRPEPWPPYEIGWDEVQMALAAHTASKYQQLLAKCDIELQKPQSGDLKMGERLANSMDTVTEIFGIAETIVAITVNKNPAFRKAKELLENSGVLNSPIIKQTMADGILHRLVNAASRNAGGAGDSGSEDRASVHESSPPGKRSRPRK